MAFFKRFGLFLLAFILLISITGCKKKDDKPAPDGSVDGQPVVSSQTPEPPPPPAYPGPEVPLVPYDGVVEHIFFHPVIAYPELAFDGDSQEKGIDDWMITVKEYNRILEKLYQNNYIIVNMNDVWSEYTDENGDRSMKKNTLYLPEGKKPLIISYDDVNYYGYMLENGLTYKLIIGENGQLYSWGLDPDGNEKITQDLDALTILDKFVRENPDFSMNGVKGCLALTGFEGILGYRTQKNRNGSTPEEEQKRQTEIAAVKPIIDKLKETGWYFGSHTWGHIRLSNDLESIQGDTQRWADEVGSLVGETQLMFYPHGERPDGDDVVQTGSVFRYLHDQGFRIFASVGIESYYKVKSDICAVICDRLHPDGTTLRYSRDRYMHFYDAKDIYDFETRPDYGTDW